MKKLNELLPEYEFDLVLLQDRVTVLVDTREQRNLHILQELNFLGVKFEAVALKYGDYSFFYINDDGEIEDFRNKCVIERKRNLEEISANFSHGRLKFYTEFQKAKNAGAKITLIVEDEEAKSKMKLRKELDKDPSSDLEFKYNKTWRTDFCGNSMIGSFKAFKERYNLNLIFCNKKETADKMLAVFFNAINNKV